MNLLAELEGKVAELKTELLPKKSTAKQVGTDVITPKMLVEATQAIKEALKPGAIKASNVELPKPEELSDADLRTIAFNNFLKTGDVTHIAPDGQLPLDSVERELFAPYLFCTITKIVGRTVYFVRASDRAQMTRSAVLVPELEGKVEEGPCVVYHQKVISQWAPADEKIWRERGYAFNALFRV